MIVYNQVGVLFAVLALGVLVAGIVLGLTIEVSTAFSVGVGALIACLYDRVPAGRPFAHYRKSFFPEPFKGDPHARMAIFGFPVAVWSLGGVLTILIGTLVDRKSVGDSEMFRMMALTAVANMVVFIVTIPVRAYPPLPEALERTLASLEAEQRAAKCCPKCGLEFNWDGTTCTHCGFSFLDAEESPPTGIPSEKATPNPDDNAGRAISVSGRYEVVLEQSSWLRRAFKVSVLGDTFTVEWNGRRTGSDAFPVLVNGKTQEGPVSRSEHGRRYLFRLQGVKGFIDVRTSLWMTLRSMKIWIGDELLYSEG